MARIHLLYFGCLKKLNNYAMMDHTFYMSKNFEAQKQHRIEKI